MVERYFWQDVQHYTVPILQRAAQRRAEIDELLGDTQSLSSGKLTLGKPALLAERASLEAWLMQAPSGLLEALHIMVSA